MISDTSSRVNALFISSDPLLPRNLLCKHISGVILAHVTDKNHPHIFALPAHMGSGFPYSTVAFSVQTTLAYSTVHNEFRDNLTR